MLVTFELLMKCSLLQTELNVLVIIIFTVVFLIPKPLCRILGGLV